jgi:hypothetical protein
MSGEEEEDLLSYDVSDEEEYQEIVEEEEPQPSEGGRDQVRATGRFAPSAAGSALLLLCCFCHCFVLTLAAAATTRGLC